MSAVFRTIPDEILRLKTLGCPDIFKEIISVPRDLVVVTGPTGSGKSTTLAAMVTTSMKQKMSIFLPLRIR